MLLLFSFRMKGLVDFFQMLVGDVGIDLGGSDRGMTEHGLDRPDVSTIDEEVGGKAMTQRMGMNVFEDAGFGSIVFDDTGDTSRGEAHGVTFTIPFVYQTFFGIGDKECRIDIAPDIEIV